MTNAMLLLSVSIVGNIILNISIETILSIVAIFISIIIPLFQHFWNKKMHSDDLEAEFYKDIFKEYLIKRIPEARIRIHYNNNKLDGTNRLIDVLNNLRRDILFFRFNDRTYYDELCKLLQKLEDKLVNRTGNMNDSEYIKFYEEVDKDIHSIYEVIMKKYAGKK